MYLPFSAGKPGTKKDILSLTNMIKHFTRTAQWD